MTQARSGCASTRRTPAPPPASILPKTARSANQALNSRTRSYTTSALRVTFFVCDPSGQYETGDPVTWTNKLVLRNKLSESNGKRMVELFVAPRGEIRYTLDGSEPRDGKVYDGPIAIGDGEVLLRAFAEAEKIETKAEFRFQAKGKKGVQIDEVKPGRLVSRTGRKLDSRSKTFEGLKQAAEKSVSLEGIVLTVGQGNRMIRSMSEKSRWMRRLSRPCLPRCWRSSRPTPLLPCPSARHIFLPVMISRILPPKLGIELHAGDIEQ